MDNLRRFPDLGAIDHEAADWLARLDSDKSLSTSEKEALCEWMARSPAHREALANLNSFWANNILTELMVPLVRHEESAGGALASWFDRNAFACGFAAFLLVLASFLTFSLTQFTSLAGGNGVYVTAVGQQKMIELYDGSQIQLNTNSQVEVEYDELFRNIRLIQGEAHFDVAENPDQPFRVYAGSGRVQAVGTAFTVQIEDAGVNVLVTEGRIALASLGGSTLDDEFLPDLDTDPYVRTQTRELGTLDAGESVTFGAMDDHLYLSQATLTEEIEVVAEAEMTRLQSWREGMLVFSGEPLEQVVSEISRYTTVSIEIADPDLRELQIGGRFRVGDVDNMFAALEANFGIEVDRVNYNQVELKTAK